MRYSAVLLLNMGGPNTLDDVEPFLFNLFSDREIIRLGPAFLQRPLAHLIASRRARQSRINYRKIGGGSPITRITTSQARALEKGLAPEGNFLVRPCMRYWQPTVEQVMAELGASGLDEIIALPLYPHYSKATTGSSLSDLKRFLDRRHPEIPLRIIPCWPELPRYIECLAARIRAGAQAFAGEPFELVYSAHSLPQKFIDEGDPYVEDIHKTIRALEAVTAIRGTLCYQSRSGPVRWLAPSTPETIERLGRQGCKNILMLPISFVSDHIETLYEIDMLFKEQAAALGIRLESTAALNDDPLFIEGLRGLVLEASGLVKG